MDKWLLPNEIADKAKAKDRAMDVSSPLPSGPFKDLSNLSNGSGSSQQKDKSEKREKNEKNEKIEKNEKGEKSDKKEKIEKGEKGEKGEMKEKKEKIEKGEKGEKVGKEKAGKASGSAAKKDKKTPAKKTRLSTGSTPKKEKAEKGDKTAEKGEKVEKTAKKAEKVEKAEKGDDGEKSEKAEKGEKGDKTTEKAEKAEKGEKGPETATKAKASVKKAGKVSTPAGSATAKKRKISELEKDVNEMKTNLDKMRKDKVKLQRTIEEQIKYPVRDDLIVSLDVKGKHPQALPEAQDTLSLPFELMNDAISVWDFLNCFRKQMSLAPIAIEPLIDLLKYTGRTSPALTELFCAPLKLLLSDSKVAQKLSALIPRRLNFAYRSASGGRESEGDLESEFDVSFNGIRFLPRLFKAEVIDPLTWQGVLRAVLLRLDPIKQLRRAASEVPESAPIPAPIARIKGVEGTVRKEAKEGREGEDDEKVDGTSSSSSSSRRLTFSVTLEEARGSLLLNGQDGDIKNEKNERIEGGGRSGGSAVKGEGSGGRNEGRLSLDGRIPYPQGKKRGVQVNKDHAFLVTSDPRQHLAAVLEAAVLLETKELHSLSVGHKLAALKAICDACYDTQRLTELLASNADERAERATAMNKKIREDKAKSKEVSVAKSAVAVEKCREVNMQAAAEVQKATKGAKPKGWKMHDPTPAQVAAMLEEMALLEKLDIDDVIDSLPEEEPLSGDEDEDNDYTLNADGTYTMRNRASVRGKANDRKRLRIERDSRLVHVNLAKECVEHALSTGGEKELRMAIKQGVKAGLRGRNDDRTYCTELLKQAYKMQLQLETTAKEEKAMSAYEKELSELCVRSTPLGSDRFHRRYWMFPHTDEQRLFVECDTSLACFRSSGSGNNGNSSGGDLSIVTVGSAVKSVEKEKEEKDENYDMIAEGNNGSSGSSGSAEKKGKEDKNDTTDIDITPVYVTSYPDGNTYAGSLKASKAVKKQVTDRSIDLPDFIVNAARDVGGGMGGMNGVGGMYGGVVGSGYGGIGGGMGGVGVDLKSDQPLCRLISSRPSARVSRWGVYSSNELWFLCEALDDRGERERELKAAIKSHFDISEPPVVFFKVGSEHIGRTVVRTFGKKRRVTGVITGWLPASGEDCPLWHVSHSDGDNEDLELHEVLEGIHAATDAEEEDKEEKDETDTAIFVERRESSRKKNEDMNSDIKAAEEKKDKKQKEKEKKEKEERESEEEPDLVSSNRSITTGYQGIKLIQLGAAGLRIELLRVQGLLLDGLKRRGSAYPKDREGRRAWEQSVKTAEEISELRSAVLELEAVVRSVQEGEDENDEEEAEREKKEARAVMLTEGWRFGEEKKEEKMEREEKKEEKKNGKNGKVSSEKSDKGDKSDKKEDKKDDKKEEKVDEKIDDYTEQLSFIGKTLRRFFEGHGKSDGIVVGYLPADKNEGMELWRMEHQDGDEEDLDLQDVLKSIRWYEENMMEDDEAKDEESEDDEEDEVEEIEEEERIDGDSSVTLWPTAGVRARWLDALQRSKTISEVSMALASLLEYSTSFGMLGMLEEEQQTILGKRKAQKPVLNVPGASPYKRKGKGHVEQEGGRTQRAAARRVISYAE